ncbi:heterokaryon incompatibility protein-domain-containing protein [Daldinia vernicosa]|uniref:heterokaryon incompatibility protein-domain-containing protein n=1 Tax=Daldinia vernicosa TaxID=114800 RepID=UPI0020073A65|nr:heterokaryon incompatibility protein-domain-containing protein [Daldinia vernicosa]KAI0854285.1 heterokaryon incompatibility protein-domain-containing protein [Daldinia vernicosa]
MWLLNTEKLTLEYFNEAQVKGLPYAILSHTWGSDEILFHELRGDQKALQGRAGWAKLDRFCNTALTHGLRYAWMDTCCIDKRNSADVSEAINSSYKYYYDSAVCFIHLEDVYKYADGASNSLGRAEVTRDQLLARLRTTRWATRGWTLQECIAPERRRFLASDWSEIQDGDDLLDALAESTRIDKDLLKDRDLLRNFCIAERMKWASRRQTTRTEDVAYCLMGIFEVHMPVLYGEGAKNAFKRLQREIMQSSLDTTIFVWHGNYESSGLLAQSPSDFAETPPLGLWAPQDLSPFSMTNIGVCIRLKIINDGNKLLAALQCNVQTPTGQWETPMIYLEPVLDADFVVQGKRWRAYRRIRCAELLTLPSKRLEGCSYEDIAVLQDEQYELVCQTKEHHVSRSMASETGSK